MDKTVVTLLLNCIVIQLGVRDGANRAAYDLWPVGT